METLKGVRSNFPLQTDQHTRNSIPKYAEDKNKKKYFLGAHFFCLILSDVPSRVFKTKCKLAPQEQQVSFRPLLLSLFYVSASFFSPRCFIPFLSRCDGGYFNLLLPFPGLLQPEKRRTLFYCNKVSFFCRRHHGLYFFISPLSFFWVPFSDCDPNNACQPTQLISNASMADKLNLFV